MDSTKRSSVLLLAHGDGWLEIFAPNHIDAKFLNVPFVPTIEGEKAAEKFIEKSLPFRYREIYWPGNRRLSGMLRRVLPSEIKKAKQEEELLNHLEKIRTESEGKKIWTL